MSRTAIRHAPSYSRVVDQRGYELFIGGQRTVVADQSAQLGRGLGSDHGELCPGGDDDVPDAVADVVLDEGTEPPSCDGFVTGQDPGSISNNIASGGKHIVRGPWLGVDIPSTRVSAKQAHASLQRRLSVEIKPAFLGHGHHAVVGDHHKPDASREAVGDAGR